jgi:antitoxin YefM
METVAISNFRQNLKSYQIKTHEDASPLLVTSTDSDLIFVVINQRDYEAQMETIRIYENAYLHNKILKGMEEIEKGKGLVKELIDE